MRRRVVPGGMVHRCVLPDYFFVFYVVCPFFSFHFFFAHVAPLLLPPPTTPLPSQQLHEFLKQHHLPASESVAAAAAGGASLAEGAAAEGTPGEKAKKSKKNRTVFDSGPRDGVSMLVTEEDDTYTECYPEWVLYSLLLFFRVMNGRA